MNLKKWNPQILGLGVLLVMIAGLTRLAFALADSGAFESQETFSNYITSFGAWGPIVLIGVIVLEVIIAPLPGGIPPVIAGFLFGPIEGAIYAWTGNIIGSVISFSVARWFGTTFAKRLVEHKEVQRYSQLVNDHAVWVWLAYSIPFVFPVDILSIVLGLTSLRFHRFVVLAALGFIPHVILPSVLGSIIDLERLETIGWSISGIIVILFVAYILKRSIDRRVQIR